MRTSYEIRRAVRGDLDRIEEIENACFAEDAFSRRVLGYLIGHASGEFLVLADNGRVEAYISLLSKRGAGNLRIYSLAVAPEKRNCGYARALMEYAARVASERGLRELTLEVNVHNDAAMALYTSCGFTAERRIAAYYHDGADALRMRKSL